MRDSGGSLILIRRGRDLTPSLSLPPSASVSVSVSSLSLSSTERKQIAGREERTRQKPALMATQPGTSSLQNCKKTRLCCLRHRVCGILLWQPEQANSLPREYFWKEGMEGRKAGTRGLLAFVVTGLCSFG
uniref:Uncharacterized protein n=1 Tax=Rousettus aegyptiacus TaxID=9407 RepID=A0A7J8D6H8_ROUAE|nr:hypothetical protein HJG63_008793 [Rousettus aegyptiacus]